MEEKRYAVLPKDSIKMYGEAAGHAELSDEVAGLLAEDVVYRLREATQNSCQFMKHAKRRRLTAEDVNKSLRNSDVQPLFGYNFSGTMAFRQTREGELSFIDDTDVDLISAAQTPNKVKQPGNTVVKAHWLAIEGIQNGGTLGIQGKGGKLSPVVSADLLVYYDNMTKAILGNDDKVMKHALRDLKKNSKIAPLLPYFVNFVNNGVKTVSHDITQLTNLLHTVQALVTSQSLYLDPKPYLELVVQSVLYCLLEPLAASINPLNDQWAVRDYAARLLAQITNDWTTPVNQLRKHNLAALREVLFDSARPFCSHYGAVMGLIAFGTKAVERVLIPHLSRYWPRLQTVMDDPSCAPVKADSHKVYGAILLAVERVLNERGNHLLNPALCTADLDDTTEALMGLEDLGMYAGTISTPGVPATAGTVSTTTTDSTDQSTSTPIKPGIHFPHLDLLGPVIELPESRETAATSVPEPNTELVGTVLTLPETSTPRVYSQQPIAELYRELYEYFGDGLATRLPVREVRDLYKRRRKEIVVSLADEDSKKSGEELLQAFLNVTDRMDDSETVDVKSENQSYGQTPDDNEMDFDGDEKSERSSRSDRSHSDESTFMDGNLTVLALGDPSEGIKITFRKLPKIQATEPVPPIPPPEPAPVIKARRRYEDSEIFEREPFCPPHLTTTFVFSYAGCVQRSHPKPAKERTIFDDSHLQWSGELLSLAHHSKIYRRRKVANLSRSPTNLHQHTSSLYNQL